MATTTNNYSIIPRHGDQKVDEHGEVIIAEAVCNRSRLCRQICVWYYFIGVILCFIFLPCACFMGCVLGRRGSSAWRLYLTSSGLRYTSVSITGCINEMFIPLNDIENVFVQETILILNGAASSQGHTLNIRISRDKVAEYIPWCQRTLCFVDYLKIAFVENATDFCSAIKQQKAKDIDSY